MKDELLPFVALQLLKLLNAADFVRQLCFMTEGLGQHYCAVHDVLSYGINLL